MKYLKILLMGLTILSIFVMTSCSTCEIVTIDNVKYKVIEEKVVVTDTFTLPRFHEHIEVDGIHHCMFLEEEEYEVIDTLYLERYIPVK